MKTDVQQLYAVRFGDTGLDKRHRVWRVLCEDFFNALVEPGGVVLDLACGYGEFIKNIRCAGKIAVDLNPDAQAQLDEGIRFFRAAATDLQQIHDETVDTAFTSNFLEHLHSKDECDQVFDEVWRVLRPGGRFIVLGPNIKYAYREYWDYYDHVLPFSDLSVAEGLQQHGFAIERKVPRFLPYTMRGGLPSGNFLIRLYLRLPLAWRLFGKQFLVIAGKPQGKSAARDPTTARGSR